MCPWAAFAQSHCLLFSFIPSSENGLKQYLGVVGWCLLLVLAAVLRLVSEAFTIFGGSSKGSLLVQKYYLTLVGILQSFVPPWLLLTSLWIRQHIQRFWPGQRSCWAVARLHAAPLLEFDDKTLDWVLCKSGFRACLQFFLNVSSHRCDERFLFFIKKKKDYE